VRGPDRARGSTTLELTLLAGAIASLTLATILARPQVRGARAPALVGLRAICLDASASVTVPRPQWPRQVGRFLREQCALARADGHEILLVEYAASAQRTFGPGSPEELLAHLDGRRTLLVPGERVASTASHSAGSHLAEALEVITPNLLDPQRTEQILVLHGDGTYTAADPGPALELLARGGVQVEWADLDPPTRVRLGIEEVLLPSLVAAGAPSAARLELYWQLGSNGGAARLPQLNWSLSGPGGTAYGVARPELPPGASTGQGGRLRWSIRLDLPPRVAGSHQFRVRVAPAGTPPEELSDGSSVLGLGDQRAAGWLNVGQRLRLAIVQREDAPALAPGWRALSQQGLDLRTVHADQLLGVLSEVDAVLTLDVGPGELPGHALQAFIDSGGGWLATIGWHFLGSWTPADQAQEGDLSRLLPLDPGSEGGTERDVVLLVDGSGSMAGEPFERVRAALFELVPAALPVDRLELRFFNESLGPVEFRSTGQTPAERRKELAPLLHAAVPHGGTDILYALGQLSESRRSTDASGLVLLLSDGRSTAVSASAGAEVRAALTRSRLDLSVLAVGEHADRGCLPSLLTHGEELIEAGDLSSLAGLLQREVNQRRVRIDPDQIAVGAEPKDPLLRDVLAAQQAAGPELLASPTCARAEWGAGSDALWVTQPEGEPLLAVKRHGQGWVGALATTPGPSWAPGLLDAPGPLTPLLMALASGGVDRSTEVVLGHEGGQLVLDHVPLSWPEPLTCELWPPLGEAIRWVAEPTASSVLRVGVGGSALDPRRRRMGPVPDELAAFPRGTLMEARILGTQGLLASVPYLTSGPAEWSGASPRVSRDLPAAGPAPVLPRPGPHPLAPWFLGLGLTLGFAAGLAPLRRLR
jgi:hypothetical protein